MSTLAHCAVDALGREGDLADAGVGGVVDGVGDGGGDAVFGDFGDGFGTEGAAGFVGLDQDGFDPGHFVGAVDMIGAEAVVDEVAADIVGHLFAVAIA